MEKVKRIRWAQEKRLTGLARVGQGTLGWRLLGTYKGKTIDLGSLGVTRNLSRIELGWVFTTPSIEEFGLEWMRYPEKGKRFKMTAIEIAKKTCMELMKTRLNEAYARQQG